MALCPYVVIFSLTSNTLSRDVEGSSLKGRSLATAPAFLPFSQRWGSPLGQKPVSTGPSVVHYTCHATHHRRFRGTCRKTGEAHDQLRTAEKWILLPAESNGNCPFQGHWGEADISICLPDAELELNHNPLVMDNLGCQLDCI